MRVLVTGATGFIGTSLVPALLRSGFEVRVAGRDAARLPTDVEHFVHGPLEAPIDWTPAVAGIDAVVHLAALAHTTEHDDSRYDRINRESVEALGAAALRAGVQRFVFVSSIRAQTGPVGSHVLSETDAPVPTDAYGRAKLAAERALNASGLPTTILRPVLVYGPGAKGNLNALLRLARLPVPLPLGSLNNKRSLLSIDNLIGAIEHVVRSERCSNETYVVADPTPISVRDILATFRRALGRSPMLLPAPEQLLRALVRIAGGRGIWDRLAGELVVDPSKLVAHGWKPDDDTAGALRRMVQPR